MKKITITGTKGKSTVSFLLEEVLKNFEDNILRTDTHGVYLNGKLKLTKEQSQAVWRLVPTNAPGRFLYMLMKPNQDPRDGVDGVAILEAALGSGTATGLGYRNHDIGIFTNVFEDHIGSRSDLQSRKDIGKSKSFVFKRISGNGFAVFNGDDDVVCDNLKYCKEGVKLIPFGLSFKFFDLKNHLNSGDVAFTIKNDQLTLLEKEKSTPLFSIKDIVWTFDGEYLPSNYNLMAITAGLYAFFDGKLPQEVIEAVVASRLDPYGGRMTLLTNKKGIKIIADYAHEKQSLKSVAQLAKKIKEKDDSKIIGVLRLAWDRKEVLIKETAHEIADYYDNFVIYDKIDGYWRQPNTELIPDVREFKQEVGKISKQFTEGLLEKLDKESVTCILREDEAVNYAAKIAKPGDVVVFIVNDDIKRSIEFIKKSFEADFA